MCGFSRGYTSKCYLVLLKALNQRCGIIACNGRTDLAVIVKVKKKGMAVRT